MLQQFQTNFSHNKTHFIGASLPWMQHLRQKGLDDFLAHGIPTRREEQWKYTHFNFLEKDIFTWAATISEDDILQAQQFLIQADFACDEAHRLVFINGHFCAPLSEIKTLSKQIEVMPLCLALKNQPEKMRPFLQSQDAVPSVTRDLHENMPVDFFSTYLNQAFMSDGAFISIPENTAITTPIHLLFLTLDANAQETPIAGTMAATMSYVRNVIVLEANAKAIFLEEHASLPSSSTHYKNVVSQITLNRGSQLDFYKLQHEQSHVFHQAFTCVKQAQESQFFDYRIALGSKLARDDLHVQLNEKAAICQLNGIYQLSGEQHVDHHTRIDHHSPLTHSEEYYKGIVSDKATGVFNGKVIVHPHAQKSKSKQTNRNLLLSRSAEVNTKPELEIYADDVQCTHGATVGQIDEAALFYLCSRGIDKVAATQLLVQGFLGEIVDRIKHQGIREMVEYYLEPV